ncbi:MAG: toll/interleukin-1 receptor domain-containing protein [Candidatus Bathyarchaeota archaeon]|nr:toll/interleukin-1 receptor domain-containing protein [Candidatus Bathyarchaeota archaeon]
MKYEIFICYRDDTGKDFSRHLWNGLKDRDITAFFAFEDIPKKYQGTETWWKFRDRAIRGCRLFLMIVTDGFEKSGEIRKEINLANSEKKVFMCMVERGLRPHVQTTLLRKNIALRDIQQIPFSTENELLRSVLKYYHEPESEKLPRTIQLTVKESARIHFPLVHFYITQVVQNNPKIKRELPHVGFNIRNSSDSPIKAMVKARVFLDGRDLGLVKGSKRGGKYMGYYDGNLLWNLNPYILFFGNFSVPDICIETEEDLRIEVKVTLIEIDGQTHELLPVGWTFLRDKNNWSFEPTGDC